MTRKQLKEIIRQIVMEEVSINEDGAANATPNISGYDAPFGAMMKRVVPKRKKKRKIDHK